MTFEELRPDLVKECPICKDTEHCVYTWRSDDDTYEACIECAKTAHREHFDINSHSHANSVHVHAYASIPHSHLLRAICHRPECSSYPTHNIHADARI